MRSSFEFVEQLSSKFSLRRILEWATFQGSLEMDGINEHEVDEGLRVTFLNPSVRFPATFIVL